jgi:hypothetical protein
MAEVTSPGTRVPSANPLKIQERKAHGMAAKCQLQSWSGGVKRIIASVLFGRALVVSEEPPWGHKEFPTASLRTCCL